MTRRQPPQPNGDRRALLSCMSMAVLFLIILWIVVIAPKLIDLLK